MNTITILEPIWKTQSVGLAEQKLSDVTEVQIVYKDKRGERLYPNKYYITKAKAMEYPIQRVRGVTLRIIPIKDLTNEVLTTQMRFS